MAGFQDTLKRRLETIGAMGTDATSRLVNTQAAKTATGASNYYGSSGPLASFGTGATTTGTVAAPTGPTTSTRNQLIKNVSSFVGTPYKWGGSSPGGFDCSGLVQYAYGKAGIRMPRVSGQQSVAGRRVGLNQLKPGDLVGWKRGGHIAVYAGNGEILESPRTGLSVRRRKIGSGEGVFGVSLSLPGD